MHRMQISLTACDCGFVSAGQPLVALDAHVRHYCRQSLGVQLPRVEKLVWKEQVAVICACDNLVAKKFPNLRRWQDLVRILASDQLVIVCIAVVGWLDLYVSTRVALSLHSGRGVV